jgi:hypothetical protein
MIPSISMDIQSNGYSSLLLRLSRGSLTAWAVSYGHIIRGLPRGSLGPRDQAWTVRAKYHNVNEFSFSQSSNLIFHVDRSWP